MKVKTEDGYTFTEQADGSWGDGDMSWPSFPELIQALSEDGVVYEIEGG